MKIKRTNVVPLIVYICTFVLFLGIEIAAVADIFFGPTTYDTAAINPIFFAFFFTLGLLLIALGILRSQRMFAGAGRRDDRLTPLAPAQPNKANAMEFGETLRLERTGRTSTGLVGATLVVAIILIAFLEFLFAPLYPDLFLHGFFGFFQPQPYIQPGQALWLEWVYMLLPVFLIAALMWQSFFNSLSNANNSKMVVTADDRGIALQNGTQKTRFIAWDDIHVFMRNSGAIGKDEASLYTLVGPRSIVSLQMLSVAALLNVPTTRPALQMTYEGGLEQYIVNVRRLIATIAARGKAPMRVAAVGFFARRISSVAPYQNLTVQDVQAFPEAQAPWQPAPEAVAMMSTYQHEVGIYPETMQQAFRNLRNWIGPLTLFYLVVFVPPILSIMTNSGDNTANITSLITTFAVQVLVFMALFYVLSNNRVRTAMPPIAANAVGITRQRARLPGVAIPWQNVHAFGVIPPTKGSPDPIYLLFTDTVTLSWAEPKNARQRGQQVQGDRRVAYANAASALHALIVARTGLPLHDLTRP